MLPSCLNWFMKSLGLNPTFIGTKSNNNKGYRYGILDDLDVCKGEGRGGWRLTDFACRTKKTDNTRYVNNNFEMMNPETQEFDFNYYMQSQSFDGVDFVTIQLGTNDIGGGGIIMLEVCQLTLHINSYIALPWKIISIQIMSFISSTCINS